MHEVLQAVASLLSHADRDAEVHLAEALKTAAYHPGEHQYDALDLLFKHAVPVRGQISLKPGVRKIVTQQHFNEALVFLLAGANQRAQNARESLERYLVQTSNAEDPLVNAVVFEAALRNPWRRMGPTLQERLVEEASRKAMLPHEEATAIKILKLALLQAKHIKKPELKERLADCVRTIHANAKSRRQEALIRMAEEALEQLPKQQATKRLRTAAANGRRKAS